MYDETCQNEALFNKIGFGVIEQECVFSFGLTEAYYSCF